MKFPLFALVLLATLPARAQAQEACPDRSAYGPAREIIRDLGKIVAPNGVQESYVTRIGGVDQWLNVRGQDRDNPMILFVHGGPAAPIMPSQWQFQRPMEEYFTVVNWDQRGAGKTYNSAARTPSATPSTSNATSTTPSRSPNICASATARTS